MPSFLIVGMLASVLVIPMVAAGRSPHVLYRPSDIDVGVDDVVGADIVREEVVRTLNLFLAHQTVRDRLGATPRRGVLFEGPPGTGKTHMAKAMAREAGVPFLFVASSSFQSMYYGQTNRKIRSYFRALRTAARREGGAIGFIEEIDAIGSTRSGMGSSTGREGISGVVNELLIQLQSFDEPTTLVRVKGWFIERLNALLPVRPGHPQAQDDAGQRAHRRGHQPGRRSRSGAASPRTVRSHDPLRPSRPRRTARPRRLLPRSARRTTRASTRLAPGTTSRRRRRATRR